MKNGLKILVSLAVLLSTSAGIMSQGIVYPTNITITNNSDRKPFTHNINTNWASSTALAAKVIVEPANVTSSAYTVWVKDMRVTRWRGNANPGFFSDGFGSTWAYAQTTMKDIHGNFLIDSIEVIISPRTAVGNAQSWTEPWSWYTDQIQIVDNITTNELKEISITSSKQATHLYVNPLTTTPPNGTSATNLPHRRSYNTSVWTSSDESVATVDADGVVTGVGLGTATIRATLNPGTDAIPLAIWPGWDNATPTPAPFATVKVTVTGYINATSLTVTPSSCDIAVGGRKQLGFLLTPDNVSDNSVKWSSSDPSIATVNADGIVKSLGMTGEFNIIAQSFDETQTVTIPMYAKLLAPVATMTFDDSFTPGAWINIGVQNPQGNISDIKVYHKDVLQEGNGLLLEAGEQLVRSVITYENGEVDEIVKFVITK